MTDRRYARARPERAEGERRSPPQVDCDRILYSYPFRRLRGKTQVFFNPADDHTCTRLEHTLYVQSISARVCEALARKGVATDSDLASAVALGHDLGHPPFGHYGEAVLSRLLADFQGDPSRRFTAEMNPFRFTGGDEAFEHEVNGLRTVDSGAFVFSKHAGGDEPGLNLTLAVRDGIVHHCGESDDWSVTVAEPPDERALRMRKAPATVEGAIVFLADKLAYIGRDIEDALRLRLVSEDALPGELKAGFWRDDHFSNGLLINAAVEGVTVESGTVSLVPREPFAACYAFCKEHIYERLGSEEPYRIQRERVKMTLEALFWEVHGFAGALRADLEERGVGRFAERAERMAAARRHGQYLRLAFVRSLHKFTRNFTDEEATRNSLSCLVTASVDFVSGMTDRFALDCFNDLAPL